MGPLAASFDPITPSPGTRYLLWRVVFDHTASAGPDDEGNPLTCDGAGRPLCIRLEDTTGGYYSGNPSVLVTNSGYSELAVRNPNDRFVNWNGGGHPYDCPVPVPVETSTWGRVKATYR